MKIIYDDDDPHFTLSNTQMMIEISEKCKLLTGKIAISQCEVYPEPKQIDIRSLSEFRVGKIILLLSRFLKKLKDMRIITHILPSIVVCILQHKIIS